MNIKRLLDTKEMFDEMKESFTDITNVKFISYALNMESYVYSISIFYRFEYTSRYCDVYSSNIRMIKLDMFKHDNKDYNSILDMLSASLVDAHVTGKRDNYVFSEYDTDVYDMFKRYDSIIEMSKFLEEKIKNHEILE